MITDLFNKGVLIEHYIQKEPNSIDVELSQDNVDILRINNVKFRIIESFEDINAQKLKDSLLKSNNIDTICGLNNMTYGTMGHFHTYQEIIDQLDSMKSKFPELITIKDSIGYSFEGRPIYAVKISDNPNINESNFEGIVYFDAIHHAREPMSMETLLYYMWWLLENYNNGTEAKNLINNNELHFVPIVNPDGYIYNQTNRPNGGGFWRKNRRDLGNEEFGVDLNRNYSVGFSDSLGSSNDPWSEVYHGQYAFSESETQAVRNYLIKIKPKTAFSCHSYGQKLLTSPGCNCISDSTIIYADFSSEFINNSFYGYGTESDLLGYTACGTTSDFMDSLGIFAWAPEIGSTFWPDTSEFCSTVQNMLQPMKYITHISGSYTRLIDFEITNSYGVSTDEMIFINLRVKNKGLGHKAENVEAFVYSETDNCSIAKSKEFVSFLDPSEIKELKFIALFSPDAILYDTAVIRIEIKENGFVTQSEIKKIIIGKSEKLFSDSFDEELKFSWESNDWETDNLDYQTSNFFATDSKNGSYYPNDSSYIMLKSSVDLSNTYRPYIFFNAMWSFSPYDGAVLLISSDSYLWDTLRIFEKHNYWDRQIIDLSQYKDEIVGIKFQIYSDGYLQSDGIYLDDFNIIDYVDRSEYDLFNKQFIQNGISAYPNPTSGILNLVKRDSLNSKISLIDFSGKLIYSDYFAENYHSIDLNNFGKGFYIIIVDNKEYQTSFKIINK